MSFETDGFCIRPVFSAQVIGGLQQELNAYLNRVARALYVPFEHSRPGASLAQRVELVARDDQSLANLLRVAVCTDAHRGPAFQALSQDRELQQHITGLLGGKPGKQIMRLRANVPTLSKARQQWHSDVARDDAGVCASVALTCWIPLMDAGPDSGGLELCVGRRTTPVAHEGDCGELRIVDSQLAGMTKVSPYCPAGTVLFLDRFTPHRALPYPGDTVRWSLVIWVKRQDDITENNDEPKEVEV